ncbi:TPA: colicin-like pore-forming protein [Yersinia enterocolitica]|uniref:colicin-like pore-forming protein n=1 Tax=Yersinia enterocolitica TaxID=630 RepID=UPI0018A7A487|nr:colicin-like pore-forming protein [Yersinia enterocolitica]ELY5259882.1 hypothetical protein [Yersinia enterocolitica]HDL7351701.1 hypothetical protein [Yersinia enterocolitica]HDL7805941.1 hypothetical protein [Yersinia enterocolitica]HDL7810056.1 hypothetical protein [Yersinia enterocolitica]
MNGKSGKGGPSNNGPSSRGPTGGIKGGPTGLGGKGKGNNGGVNVAVGGSMDTTIGGYSVHVVGVRSVDSGEKAGQVGNRGIHWGGGNGNGGGNSGNRNGAASKAETARREAEEKALAQAEWDAAHPVEVAERQVNEAEEVCKREQDNVTQKQAVRDSLKGTVEGRLLTDTAAYPLSYGKEERLSIPGTNGFSLQLTFSVENREQMDKLLKDGGTAYVHNVLQWGEVSAPTESGLIVGNGIKTATAAEYENLRQRVLNRQNEITSAQTAFNIAIESRHQAEQRKKVTETHLNAVRQQVAADKKAQEEIDAVKDAVKFTADFYKELTSKYGDNASKIAQELADTAKGKQIRNVDEALKAFDQYKNVLNKKFSAKDREAIAKALESVDRGMMAKNLAKFSKALGVTSKVIDGIDIVVEFKKAVRTDIWRPFFVKLETLAAGAGASWLVAFAFAVLTATPLGIVGFGFLIAIVGFLINDELIEKINKDVLGV